MDEWGTIERTRQTPEVFLRSIGDVFTVFDQQDSGNVSYGLLLDGDRYFVKTAGLPDDRRPFLDHAARVRLLHRAAELAQRFQHPALPQWCSMVDSAHGPMLVYRWVDGELLAEPASLRRFRSLPTSTVVACLDDVFDLHKALDRVAVDFYFGCLMYQAVSARTYVIDLDHYVEHPFSNKMGRMFGSKSFMAPEEFTLGARIDQRTTVFTLGRLILLALSEGTALPGSFRGSNGLLSVAIRATAVQPEQRYSDIGTFCAAWFSARSLDAIR